MVGFRIFVATILFAIAGTGIAAAQIAHETRIKHYKIGGKTPLGLVNGMFSSGKKSGDRVLLASLSTKTDYSIEFPQDSCRNGKIKITAKFVMRLPKPRHERRLSRKTATTFGVFYKFLKKHEETHRKIMLQCLARVQGKVNRMLAKTRSCAALKSAKSVVDSIATAEAKRCRFKHDALDRRDEPKISGFSLYKSANLETRASGRSAPPNSRLGLSYQPVTISDHR